MCSCGYRMTAANKCIKVEVPTTQAPPQAPCEYFNVLNNYHIICSGRKQRVSEDSQWHLWWKRQRRRICIQTSTDINLSILTSNKHLKLFRDILKSIS